jgi:hypothetical protein
MGRTLEALRRTDKPTRPEEMLEPAGSPPPPADHAAEGEMMDSDEVPFIEVGGRGRALEASPSVLVDCPPMISAESLLADRKMRFDPVTPRAPLFADGASRGFIFQPAAPTAAPPMNRVAPEITAFHEPAHPLSEQYRTLLARIEEGIVGNAPHILLFTAVTPGAGTTTMLLNLAVTSCGNGNRRVLVVDANLSRPAVARRLGVIHAA